MGHCRWKSLSLCWADAGWSHLPHQRAALQPQHTAQARSTASTGSGHQASPLFSGFHGFYWPNFPFPLWLIFTLFLLSLLLIQGRTQQQYTITLTKPYGRVRAARWAGSLPPLVGRESDWCMWYVMFSKNSHHSTSSSAWFCRTLPIPTKIWSLFPLPLNLGGTVASSTKRTCESGGLGGRRHDFHQIHMRLLSALSQLSLWNPAIMLRSHEEVTCGCSGWQLHATTHVSGQTSRRFGLPVFQQRPPARVSQPQHYGHFGPDHSLWYMWGPWCSGTLNSISGLYPLDTSSSSS